MRPRIIIDTREKMPYALPERICLRACLEVGDYSIEGHELKFALERKTKVDMFNTWRKACVDHAGNFLRNMAHMEGLKKGRALVIVECTRTDFLDGPRHYKGTAKERKAHGQKVSRAIDHWWVAYGVPFFFMIRDEAEVFARETLEWWRRQV